MSVSVKVHFPAAWAEQVTGALTLPRADALAVPTTLSTTLPPTVLGIASKPLVAWLSRKPSCAISR